MVINNTGEEVYFSPCIFRNSWHPQVRSQRLLELDLNFLMAVTVFHCKET